MVRLLLVACAVFLSFAGPVRALDLVDSKGLCASFVRPPQNGIPVLLHSCDRFEGPWALTEKGEFLKAQRNERYCIDVKDGRTEDGSPVVLWPCNGGANQRWQVLAGTLHDASSNKCLDAKLGRHVEGEELVIRDCNASDDQKWKLPGVRIASPRYVEEAKSQFCLDVEALPAAHRVILFRCHSAAHQEWIVADGTITGFGGECLEGTAENSQAVTRPCNKASAQQWRLVDGQIKWGPDLSKCLDIEGRKWIDRNRIILYGCNGGANQQWTFQ